MHKTKRLIDFFDERKIEKSINFIKENAEDDIVFVGFSGGKDSICLVELMRLSGVKYELYYSVTGLDPPEVVKFIKSNYPECIFLHPKKSFWRDLKSNVPPSHNIRWCCTSLKKEPTWKLPHSKRFFGIRAEESSSRSKRREINRYYEDKKGYIEYYPIFSWNEADVWDFITSNNLKYPEIYDQGFDRVGCIVCPFHSTSTGKLHERYRERWPLYFKLFEKVVKEVYYKRVSQGKTMYYPTPEDFLKAWYFNSCVSWYRGEKKKLLFAER